MIGKLIEFAWHKLVERVIPFDDDVIDRLIAEFVGRAGQPMPPADYDRLTVPPQTGDYCERRNA